MTVGKITTNPVEIKDFKADNIETQRASQENNYIYRLMKKAENGSSNAIKKLLEYSLIDFNPDVDFAAKLMDDARDMLAKANDLYTNGAGKLSDLSIDTVKESILQEFDCDLSDSEKEQKFHDEVNAMEQLL